MANAGKRDRSDRAYRALQILAAIVTVGLGVVPLVNWVTRSSGSPENRVAKEEHGDAGAPSQATPTVDPARSHERGGSSGEDSTDTRVHVGGHNKDTKIQVGGHHNKQIDTINGPVNIE